MAICHRMEVRVYDRFGGGTPVTVPAVDIRASLGVGGEGFLTFNVDARAEPLASNPTLLDDCVIKVAIPLTEPGTTFTEVAAYAQRGRAGTRWDGAGRRVITVNAGSLFTVWSQDAVLHPEGNSIEQMSANERYFGWMSTIYDWTRDADRWGAPTSNAGRQDSTTGVRAGNPDGWPTELGGAYWITRGAVANGTRHLFIANCVVPSDCYLTVYHSSDESSAVYFGGALVIQTSSSETGYQSISTWSGWVARGTYRVGIDKTSVFTRGGDGRDPVLLAVATNTDEGDVDNILLLTNTSDWKICTLDPDTGEAPSLTPGEIVAELHTQAKNRGVDTWEALTLGFTGLVDSDGLAWPVREERVWRIGYDRYLDMIEGLGDLGLACDITADLTLEGWSKRGTDRSATVTLHTPPTSNADIASISEQGVGVESTYLPVETQDGWTIVQNTTAAAIYGRRESALSLGNAPSIAQGRRLGQKVMDDRLSRPETEWPIVHYARAGAVPFSSYWPGDTITTDIAGSSTKCIVLDIGIAAENTESIIEWTTKTTAGIPDSPGHFYTMSGVAVASGGESLLGPALGGAAIFGTVAGGAVASGGAGALVGLVGGGAALFRSLLGDATAAGGSGSMSGGAVWATAAGSALASGGDTAFGILFETTPGSATAAGDSSSLIGDAMFASIAHSVGATASGATASLLGDSGFPSGLIADMWPRSIGEDGASISSGSSVPMYRGTVTATAGATLYLSDQGGVRSIWSGNYSTNGPINLSGTGGIRHAFVYCYCQQIVPYNYPNATGPIYLTGSGLNTWRQYNYAMNGIQSFDGNLSSSRPQFGYPDVWTSGAWHIYEVKHDGTTRSVLYNGTVYQSGAATLSVPTTGILNGSANGTSSFQKVGRFLAFDRVLDSTEAASVRAKIIADA